MLHTSPEESVASRPPQTVVNLGRDVLLFIGTKGLDKLDQDTLAEVGQAAAFCAFHDTWGGVSEEDFPLRAYLDDELPTRDLIPVMARVKGIASRVMSEAGSRRTSTNPQVVASVLNERAWWLDAKARNRGDSDLERRSLGARAVLQATRHKSAPLVEEWPKAEVVDERPLAQIDEPVVTRPVVIKQETIETPETVRARCEALTLEEGMLSLAMLAGLNANQQALLILHAVHEHPVALLEVNERASLEHSLARIIPMFRRYEATLTEEQRRGRDWLEGLRAVRVLVGRSKAMQAQSLSDGERAELNQALTATIRNVVHLMFNIDHKHTDRAVRKVEARRAPRIRAAE